MRGRERQDGTAGSPEIRGEWEAHLTVACPVGAVDAVGGLADWAARRGLGFVHIRLARGVAASQPMVTLVGRGSAAEWDREVAALAAELAAAGYPVVRTKTEAAPWAAGVPADDAAPGVAHPGRYFEHHVKLLLPPDHDRAALERRVVPHTAHLSWNARRSRADGQQERFVTQRCAGVGRVTATRRLAALLAALAAPPEPYRVLEVEREYVVHDSNLALDDGWITAEGTSPDAVDAPRVDEAPYVGGGAHVDGGASNGGGAHAVDAPRAEGSASTDDVPHVDAGASTDEALHVDGGASTEEALRVDRGAHTVDAPRVDEAPHVDGGAHADAGARNDGGTRADHASRVDEAPHTDDGFASTEEALHVDGGASNDGGAHADHASHADEAPHVDAGAYADGAPRADRGASTEEALHVDAGAHAVEAPHTDHGRRLEEAV